MYPMLIQNYEEYAAIRGHGAGVPLTCDGDSGFTLRGYVDATTAATGYSGMDVDSYFEVYSCGLGNGKSDGDGGEFTCRGGRGIDIRPTDFVPGGLF